VGGEQAQTHVSTWTQNRITTVAPQVRCEDRPGAAPNSSLPVR